MSQNSEALSPFAELESAAQQDRDKAHDLARLLNLVPQWWTGNSVLDRSVEPCHPQGYIAREDWFHCHVVRLALQATLDAPRR